MLCVVIIYFFFYLQGAGEEESSRLTDEPDETDPIAATVKHQLSDYSISASDVAEAAIGGNASSKDGSVSGKRKQVSQQNEGSKRLKPDESYRPTSPDDADSWGFDDDSDSRRDDDFNGTTENGNHRPINETRITTENADEYTIFGHYIACKLRKLNDSRLLATAQNQITNYLFQLEMGNLDAKLVPS